MRISRFQSHKIRMGKLAVDSEYILMDTVENTFLE